MKKQYLILSAFLLLALLIFLNNNFLPLKFTTAAIQSIFSSPKKILYSLKIGGESNPEIQKLRDENIMLAKKISELSRLKRDNEALRSQFETSPSANYKLMPAQVIGFTGRFSYPVSLIIDKGSKNGIKKEMAVIFKDNLVGRIGSVNPNYSEVILVVNSKFSGLGKTAEGQIPGVVTGKEDFILLDRVETSKAMVKGETVLTKGDVNEGGVGVPNDIIVGRISSVNKTASLPFQTAKVESLLQFSKLNTVFVITSL